MHISYVNVSLTMVFCGGSSLQQRYSATAAVEYRAALQAGTMDRYE